MPWHRSLAVRLGLWNFVLSIVGAIGVLGGIYWLVAHTLDTREREALELRAEQFAVAFNRGGVGAVRALLEQREESPHVRSLFVRIVGRDGTATFAKTPPEWSTDDGAAVLVPDGWGFLRPERMQTVRVPRDAQRDFTIVSRTLPNGVLLQLARSTDNREVLLEPLRRTMVLGGLAGVVIAALAAGFIAWRATRPVRQVASTARKIISTGDLSARVPPAGRDDEIGDLVAQFNTLLERNSSLLRATREALDNVAHDVRTPLTRLRAGAEAALASNTDTVAARDALADCIEETDRIRRLLDTLLDISAAEAGVLGMKKETVNVPDLLRDVVELYSMIAEEMRIEVSAQAPDDLFVFADATRIRQVVANLVDNAIKYTPDGGKVFVIARQSANRVQIIVQDTGTGISPEDMDRIWRRLYRGDSSRSQRGLGLGLSVVKAVVEAHEGTVGVRNDPRGGAVFTVDLPAAAPARAAVPALPVSQAR
ncbi:MAG: sensor histidine kinase [Opitutaceae bacterium]